MFQSQKVQTAFKNLLGWRQHHDTDDVNIDTDLTVTESGEFYQQKHSALRLDIIKATLPDNYEISKYLADKVKDSTNEMLNDLLQYRQVNKYGKTLLETSQLLNRYGWLNDKITNENRFVGYQIRVFSHSGLSLAINQIGLQFSEVESFKLYLFHSSKNEPLKEIDVTTSGTAKWDWSATDIDLNAFDLEQYSEGVFILGYYQSDLSGQAINNTDFDFDRGSCGNCGSPHSQIWKNIQEHYSVYPFYVANGNYIKGKMFDLNDVFYINNETYGLNLRVSAKCDLTSFFIENKFAFKNLLAYKVTLQILNDMKFSQQINYIEENIKMMIIRDLEGDTETKAQNLVSKYTKELQSVAYNTSGINEKCLPCEGAAYEPDYDVI